MRNSKRIISSILAVAMIGSTLTACSTSNKNNQEKEFLNTGSYEGCGLKFTYDPSTWVNMRNEGTGIGKKVLLYTKDYDSFVEVSRIDESVQTTEDAESYINQRISEITEIASDASVENVEIRAVDDGVVHAKYNVVFKENESTETDETTSTTEDTTSSAPVKNNQEFANNINIRIEDGKSVCIYSETVKPVYNKYADAINEISDSFTFSDVTEPGEAHTEEERLYNLTPTISDIEGYSYLKDIEYTDNENNVRHAYCVPNQISAPYIYDHTAVSVSDGITMMSTTIKKESEEQDALSVIRENLGTWYDIITTENSGFFPSKINKDYRTISKNEDSATYVLAYAPYNTVKNEAGEMERLASEIYESIVFCKENGDYIEITEIEIQNSYKTENTNKIMEELARALNLDYEELLTPFNGEFKMDPSINSSITEQPTDEQTEPEEQNNAEEDNAESDTETNDSATDSEA